MRRIGWRFIRNFLRVRGLSVFRLRLFSVGRLGGEVFLPGSGREFPDFFPAEMLISAGRRGILLAIWVL